ncbi:hypothetical protein C2G38_2052725 [Gigaspora rosea]|uniref:Uncharacterized protein n=1 Tax=Gigaspora rosea TaxID=44941 RepID=A0A397WAE5_9GLOM|nr:hypothetical protein C2G38_2052725 [Gigaspora rosea]
MKSFQLSVALFFVLVLLSTMVLSAPLIDNILDSNDINLGPNDNDFSRGDRYRIHHEYPEHHHHHHRHCNPYYDDCY